MEGRSCRWACVLREHWMLVAAAAAASASMVVVPPDGTYLGYFDWKTIGCLFCVLAVASALRRLGAFDRVARIAIARFGSPRTLALTLVLTTAVFSALFTNDVALVIMLPLAAATLVELSQVRLVPTVFALQALAANLCGMVTPFGNPQNLYLYSYYHLGLGEFLTTMAGPFLLSAIGIIGLTWVMTGKADRAPETSAAARPSSPIAPVMPLPRRRLMACALLFVVSLLAVFRLVPLIVAVAAVVATLLVIDRKALMEVDYPLLATFLCFFVFAGNMARIPALGEGLGPLMDQWGLLVSAGVSQLISNVPAAVVLSHFTEAWQPLLVGVNIGGAGTFVGSLASLIAIRYYIIARKVFPRLRTSDASTTARFLRSFALLNGAFFIVLVVACQLMLG